MLRTALFPGSFDPVTNGHLDLVRQAARLADRLVLAIGTHPGKAPLFDAEERRAMIEETCGALARASGCDFACITFGDLVVAAAQREGATLLIPGLRTVTDFASEIEMPALNPPRPPRRPPCRRFFCRPRRSPARSAPHWCGRSHPSAATYRRSFHRPLPSV